MTASAHAPDSIRVEGARVHNLKSVDVTLPRDQLVVVTGPSGSGKSSLAFDTLYAEGQRRYVESLSAYARGFLDQLEPPDVDSIEGLSPAVAIEQKSISRSPRSTVGTATEIADHLRLLFARVGEPECPKCGNPIQHQTIAEMCDRVVGLPTGTKIQVMAPVVRGRTGAYRKEIESYRDRGFTRIRVDGETLDLADDVKLARTKRHDIDVVIDRLVVKEKMGPRLAGSIETATRLADGLCIIDIVGGGPAGDPTSPDEWLLSRRNACVDCGVNFPELAPRFFSFNNPAGACPSCNGLGLVRRFDPALVVPEEDAPLRSAIEPWQRKRTVKYYATVLADLADHLKVDLDTPWRELAAKTRKAVLEGVKGEVPFSVGLRPTRGGKPRKNRVKRPWKGVLDELARREDERLVRYQTRHVCPDCEGARLRVEARHVRVGGQTLPELSRLPIDELAGFLTALDLRGTRGEIARRVVDEIAERLAFLLDVGLGYLSLDRESGTLSGGEAQRIRLATQIGTALLGVLYILDEPSIGLHARDHARLLASLERLRDLGNTVVVVEHDESTIRAADFVIDMGPGAGRHGGQVVATGDPEKLASDTESPTGTWLAGRRSIESPAARREGSGESLVLRGARGHNLKRVTFTLPLGRLVVVTGVSGSGKSTLVNDTLHRALAARLHGALAVPEPFDSLEGEDAVDRVIDVDQAPIGRSPRSNPATYSGAFDGIRRLFSQVPDARARGFGPGRFSFNVKGGRCETCQGDGQRKIEMSFLPDLYVHCDVCAGRRYNRETLEIRYKGRSIADVLEMPIEDALDLLGNIPTIARPLQALVDVGLGYLHLGQSATTLSGGEAQRVKLARELAKRSTGRTLYLLDEPTTGLHFADVAKLLELIHRLVDLGNTVVVIEHHLDVVKCADWVIDLGPEGGGAGGEIVAEGTPEAIVGEPRSLTGHALAETIAASSARRDGRDTKGGS